MLNRGNLTSKITSKNWAIVHVVMPAGEGLSPWSQCITCTTGLAVECLLGVETLPSFSTHSPLLGLHSVLLPCSQGGMKLTCAAHTYISSKTAVVSSLIHISWNWKTDSITLLIKGQYVTSSSSTKIFLTTISPKRCKHERNWFLSLKWMLLKLLSY